VVELCQQLREHRCHDEPEVLYVLFGIYAARLFMNWSGTRAGVGFIILISGLEFEAFEAAQIAS